MIQAQTLISWSSIERVSDTLLSDGGATWQAREFSVATSPPPGGRALPLLYTMQQQPRQPSSSEGEPSSRFLPSPSFPLRFASLLTAFAIRTLAKQNAVSQFSPLFLLYFSWIARRTGNTKGIIIWESLAQAFFPWLVNHYGEGFNWCSCILRRSELNLYVGGFWSVSICGGGSGDRGDCNLSCFVEESDVGGALVWGGVARVWSGRWFLEVLWFWIPLFRVVSGFAFSDIWIWRCLWRRGLWVKNGVLWIDLRVLEEGCAQVMFEEFEEVNPSKSRSHAAHAIRRRSRCM